MVFWLYMLAMDLLIPATMILCGWFFRRGGPKRINHFCGYRTKRSMRNGDTWRFAHQVCGNVWFRWGLLLIPISLAVMLCVVGRSPGEIGTVGGVLTMVQMIPLIGGILVTERALKRTFDPWGNRR